MTFVGPMHICLLPQNIFKLYFISITKYYVFVKTYVQQAGLYLFFLLTLKEIKTFLWASKCIVSLGSVSTVSDSYVGPDLRVFLF